MGDVRLAGEALDGRSAEAMPCRVQDANGNPEIYDACAGHLVRSEPVAPGARHQCEPVVRREAADERGGKLVDVFPDAGALAECRPIIQQDAQTRQS